MHHDALSERVTITAPPSRPFTVSCHDLRRPAAVMEPPVLAHGVVMRVVAQLFGVAIMVMGAIGAVSPDTVIRIGRQLATPAGLYGLAIARIAMGFVVTMAAQGSRSPRALRAIGLFLIIAGLGTPAFGITRTLALIDWATRSADAVRIIMVLPILLGAFVAYAVGASRDAIQAGTGR
jgi:hypothetical protein